MYVVSGSPPGARTRRPKTLHRKAPHQSLGMGPPPLVYWRNSPPTAKLLSVKKIIIVVVDANQKK